MTETYKYAHGIYSVTNIPLEKDVKTTTRVHRYKTKTRRYCTRLLQRDLVPLEPVDALSLQAFKSRLDSSWQERRFLP